MMSEDPFASHGSRADQILNEVSCPSPPKFPGNCFASRDESNQEYATLLQKQQARNVQPPKPGVYIPSASDPSVFELRGISETFDDPVVRRAQAALESPTLTTEQAVEVNESVANDPVVLRVQAALASLAMQTTKYDASNTDGDRTSNHISDHVRHRLHQPEASPTLNEQSAFTNSLTSRYLFRPPLPRAQLEETELAAAEGAKMPLRVPSRKPSSGPTTAGTPPPTVPPPRAPPHP